MKRIAPVILLILAAACAPEKAAAPAGAADDVAAVATAINALKSERGWTCWQSFHRMDAGDGMTHHYAVGKSAAGSGVDPFEIVVSRSCNSAGANCTWSAAPRAIGAGEMTPELDETKC